MIAIELGERLVKWRFESAEFDLGSFVSNEVSRRRRRRRSRRPASAGVASHRVASSSKATRHGQLTSHSVRYLLRRPETVDRLLLLLLLFPLLLQY